MENLTTWEIFQLYKQGIKLPAKTLAEWEPDKLNIKHPSELIANNPVMQKIIKKHWDTLIEPRLKKKNPLR